MESPRLCIVNIIHIVRSLPRKLCHFILSLAACENTLVSHQTLSNAGGLINRCEILFNHCFSWFFSKFIVNLISWAILFPSFWTAYSDSFAVVLFLCKTCLHKKIRLLSYVLQIFSVWPLSFSFMHSFFFLNCLKMLSFCNQIYQSFPFDFWVFCHPWKCLPQFKMMCLCFLLMVLF